MNPDKTDNRHVLANYLSYISASFVYTGTLFNTVGSLFSILNFNYLGQFQKSNPGEWMRCVVFPCNYFVIPQEELIWKDVDILFQNSGIAQILLVL